MQWFSQNKYEIRLEWGMSAIEHLAREVDCAVIVDVMSFSTCVSLAVDKVPAFIRIHGKTRLPANMPGKSERRQPILTEHSAIKVTACRQLRFRKLARAKVWYFRLLTVRPFHSGPGMQALRFSAAASETFLLRQKHVAASGGSWWYPVESDGQMAAFAPLLRIMQQPVESSLQWDAVIVHRKRSQPLLYGSFIRCKTCCRFVDVLQRLSCSSEGITRISLSALKWIQLSWRASCMVFLCIG